MTEILGEVPLSRCHPWISTHVYRCLNISNPNMMFLGAPQTDVPLFEVDVNAWLLLAFITGDVEIPILEIMRQRNEADNLHLINSPVHRYGMDADYCEAWSEYCRLHEEHWLNNPCDPRLILASMEEDIFSLQYLARDMYDSSYPVCIGTFEKLNKKGKQFLTNLIAISNLNIKEGSQETFRDGDPSKIRSIFTGIAPVPLRKLWLKLEESDYDDLLKECRGSLKKGTSTSTSQLILKDKQLHYSRSKVSDVETISTLF